MNWLDALILGLVQGLAEFLPISSSGHIEIFRKILGIDLPEDQALLFTIMVHAATVLSTIVAFHSLFGKLCKSFFTFKKDNNFYYVCKILISCIPVAIVGLFFKNFVEQFFGNGLLIVGISLCITALLLTFAFYSGFNHKTGTLIPADKGRDISWLDAIIIGCAQAIAVLPGLSRSGTTIATGILLRDKRSQVATFSFLMVILPILGEALLDTKEAIENPQAIGQIGILPLITGFIIAFLSGWCACRWMVNIVKKGKLLWFAIYCVIMGTICILWK